MRGVLGQVNLSMKCCPRLSETSPSIRLDVLILLGISLELDEILRWVLKIQPGPLGSDVDEAGGVTGPPVGHAVEVVVGIGVASMLVAVEAGVAPVHVILRLQQLRV